MSLLPLYLSAGNTSIKEIFKISQLKDNETICIAMNKKGGASCITTHLLIQLCTSLFENIQISLRLSKYSQLANHSLKSLENVIDHFMPKSRRKNRFCEELTTISEIIINQASNISGLRAAFAHNRYHKVNLEAYVRHRIVEFRQHGGSTNFTKMSAWIHFLVRMITFAKHGKVQTGITLQNVSFLSESEKLYFRLRIKKLPYFHRQP